MNISSAQGAAGRAGAGVLPWQRVALLSLVLLTLALGFVNLPYAPRTWFDEGSHLHVPKTLLRYGVYADISSEGFRYYGPTVGVGPTVMLPIAASFQLFGVGLEQGRAVIVVYLLVVLAAGYTLARRLHGAGAALLALLLLLASRTLRFEGLVEYGRQVLGEVPGVAFLFLGCLAWAAAVDKPRGWRLPAVAGLCFGLALVTKNQFVLIVPPALALAALLDWRYYRAGDWWLRLLPLMIACGCFGLWTLVQLQFLGPGSFTANLAQTRKAAGGAIFVFDPAATLRAARYIVQPYGLLLLPALAYALWRCRERGARALAELPAVLIPSLWICWYLISLGWPRYALPAVAFGALAVARLVLDLAALLLARAPRAAAWGLALYVALAALAPLALTARVVLSPDDSAHLMAAHLDASVPLDTVVETWEPELGALTDHRYHYPPIELLDVAVRSEWLGGPSLHYDGLAARPEYVVVGAFGQWVGIYSAEALARDYTPAYSAGPYTLYRRARP
jgi:4-amino-4-deoxy-L-arabinose transferase-like glycosyltransferase